eukprot:6154719-Pleurochrysis_carterae.AAC.1
MPLPLPQPRRRRGCRGGRRCQRAHATKAAFASVLLCAGRAASSSPPDVRSAVFRAAAYTLEHAEAWTRAVRKRAT